MDALARLNPHLPAEALEDAFRRLKHPEGATLEARNRAFHRMLVDGVTVEYRRPDGHIAGAQVRVLDFEESENNDWLAVNQFTVTEGRHTRRPDIVLFVNGLPLAIVELIQRTVSRLRWPGSPPGHRRVGVVQALADDRRLPDRGPSSATARGAPQGRVRQALLPGAPAGFHRVRGRRQWAVAGYHQFHAVRVAVAETLRAAKEHLSSSRVREALVWYQAGMRPGGKAGDCRVGVVWHTQGAGKSLTIVFYAARVARDPEMENPTIVVLTDRND